MAQDWPGSKGGGGDDGGRIGGSCGGGGDDGCAAAAAASAAGHEVVKSHCLGHCLCDHARRRRKGYLLAKANPCDIARIDTLDVIAMPMDPAQGAIRDRSCREEAGIRPDVRAVVAHHLPSEDWVLVAVSEVEGFVSVGQPFQVLSDSTQPLPWIGLIKLPEASRSGHAALPM